MCGIAGSVALRGGLPPPGLDDLRSMLVALAHRGPDASGLYRDEQAGMVHARLSIIDLATGQQPMSDGDGQHWIVFNGEIFNYVELREELRGLGWGFRTSSDTEVIVQAYRAWGVAAFERFNGQFALALWDPAARTMVLARDRLGVRPLYLAVHGGRLWFASEVKAIFAGDPSIPRRFDPVGLAETFTFWATVAPQTVWHGITQLEPGHVMTVRDGTMRTRPYWQPRYPLDEPSGQLSAAVDDFDALGVRLLERLERAVSLRMLRADVPVGAYLSGGLDSSVIAALGHRATGGSLRTFSIRFTDPEFDESRYQRAMVKRLGSEHHEISVSGRDIAEVFPTVVEHAEQPVLRTAPAPLFLLSRLVQAAGVKVVLTGEGADEMLGGYDLFREAKVRRFWGRLPDSRLRPALIGRLYPYLSRSPANQRTMAVDYLGRGRERWPDPGFGHQVRWRSTAVLRRMLTDDTRAQARSVDVEARLLGRLPPDFDRWSHLAQDQHLEVTTLLSGYLLSSQGDRMLMANSIEGRFPFLDVDVVEFANGLPSATKLWGLDEKALLKRAARGLVPDEILQRSKQPYRAPDAVAFARDPTEWVLDTVSASAVKDAGVFDPEAVRRLWRKCTQGAADQVLSNADNMAIVAVVSTGHLSERMVRASPPRAVWTHDHGVGTLVDMVTPAPAGARLPVPHRSQA